MGYHPWYSVLLSERTGHYYIKLSAWHNNKNLL
jgi:hypothetical protein